ncbi:hypothetical protein EVAR_42676_1 [Eumeta japonica]|uniref:Uncharacterized protein n=1 Tax=Eumeta variegata TaxID=151549 RepID=A0A4C1X2B6_EUMVA|nr:hypothetical protein EVAR_42676_1 [Eumeta japonica]
MYVGAGTTSSPDDAPGGSYFQSTRLIYPIPTHNTLVTPLGWRVSMGCDENLRSDSSHSYLFQKYYKKIEEDRNRKQTLLNFN